MKKFLDKAVKKGVWKMSNTFPTPKALHQTIAPDPDPVRFPDREHIINAMEIEGAKTNRTKIPKPIYSMNSTSEQQAELKKKYGFSNWYDWNCANWGTKWDCNSRDTSISIMTDTDFAVTFSSAWSPPALWVIRMMDKYPKLRFSLTYMETGSWFAGNIYQDDNGDVCENEGEPINQTLDGELVEDSDDEEKGDFKVISTGEYVTWDDIETINPFE